MTPHVLIQVAIAILGLVAILAGALNWEWFFQTNAARMFTTRMKRKTARLFYIFLGILYIALAIFLYTKTNK